jgi:hypothetical protein
LQDEFNGRTAWWSPYWEAQQRGPTPLDQIGGTIDITVHPRGDSWAPFTPRFSSRVTAIEPSRRLQADLFDGTFEGTIEWRLEPLGDQTRVEVEFRVRTSGVIPSLLALVVNMGERHSETMQRGFAGLARHLA